MARLLDVQGLNIRFKSYERSVHAVQGVSFQIEEGETLALVGESGSGKSATAHAILQLLPQETSEADGVILFNEVNLLKLSAREMRDYRGRQIGMIFQEPLSALNPTMKAGLQIAESLQAHFPLSRKEAAEQAVELLREVGIPDPAGRFHQYPHELSGGMRQRVLIAIAIACKPSLLIADEPTTALDPTIQRQILELLLKLKIERGMSLLLITHDLGVVAGYGDRVVVMEKGKVVETAGVETLFARPAHPYTQMLLQASRSHR